MVADRGLTKFLILFKELKARMSELMAIEQTTVFDGGRGVWLCLSSDCLVRNGGGEATNRTRMPPPSAVTNDGG